MLTVSIIAILASVGGYSWREISHRAQANKIASDFRKIEGAWQLWRADTHGFISAQPNSTGYPHEDVFYNGPARAENCSDEAYIAETDIIANNNAGATNYRGPYMSIDPRDPFGRQYEYDRDGALNGPSDIYSTAGCVSDPITGHNNSAGINSGTDIVLHMCAADINQYRPLAPLLDRAIDGSDGACSGKLRWRIVNGQTGNIQYQISEQN